MGKRIFCHFSLFAAAVLLCVPPVSAQSASSREESTTARIALSTNAVDWGWYVTPNIAAQYALGPRWTLEAGAWYNRWTFNDGDTLRRNRQARQQYALGVRWWSWYVYSGWYLGAAAQYREYSRRSYRNALQKEEGDAYGVSFKGGYALQVNPWFNLDFNLGLFGGAKTYRIYEGDSSCPTCGRRVDADGNDGPSRKAFIMPGEVTVGAMFIF